MINLREIIGAIRDQLVLSEKVSRNKEDIEKVRTELKELENKVERLTDVIQKFPDAILQMVKEEMREFYEKEAAARKIALLELENKFLQQNRELPPGKKKLVMKKAFLLTSLLFIFFAFSANTFAQEKDEKPDTPIEVLMEQDAAHNLNVAWQYFKLKKAYKAVLMRTEETIDAFPMFSKIDEVLYLAGMSSYNLSENKGKQKIVMENLTDEDKEKFAPERLRENAVAYLSRIVEQYPDSKYKDDAAKTLQKLKNKN